MGELRGQLRVSDLVDVPNALFGVPGVTYLSIGITSPKQPLDAFLATIIRDVQTP